MLAVVDNAIIHKLMTPPILTQRGNLVVKLAENEEEIRAALNLRYRVFMEEQGHLQGVAEPEADIDVDEFDKYCLHLIIVLEDTHEVIGTYRVHPGSVALQNIGFYSQREYDIRGLDKIAPYAIEVGRSCVNPQYRNGTVVGLLWFGLGELHRRCPGNNYLLGCASLETADPVIGWALYEYFKREGNIISNECDAIPQPGFELPAADPAEVERYLTGDRAGELHEWMPPLLKGYIRLGANICGVPLLDREFGAIDFMVLLNFQRMNAKYAHHFL